MQAVLVQNISKNMRYEGFFLKHAIVYAIACSQNSHITIIFNWSAYIFSFSSARWL